MRSKRGLWGYLFKCHLKCHVFWGRGHNYKESTIKSYSKIFHEHMKKIFSKHDKKPDKSSGFEWSKRSRGSIEKLSEDLQGLLDTALQVSKVDFGVYDAEVISFKVKPAGKQSDIKTLLVADAVREASIEHTVDVFWGNSNTPLSDFEDIEEAWQKSHTRAGWTPTEFHAKNI